jgi:single-strand DNA-binding protein
MNETTVTVVGNLVDDPRMRTTDSGVEVTSFRVASTARRFDREAARWVDAGSVFLSVTCWRALGVHVVASLRKGDPVLVTGRLFTRQYERDGQLRSAYEVDAVAVGPDLARGTATFQRVARVAVPATYSATDENGVPETPGQDADPAAPRAVTGASSQLRGGVRAADEADGVSYRADDVGPADDIDQVDDVDQVAGVEAADGVEVLVAAAG